MVMADSASADGHIHSRYLHGLQEKEDVLVICQPFLLFI
jgi:hypothetical protein